MMLKLKRIVTTAGGQTPIEAASSANVASADVGDFDPALGAAIEGFCDALAKRSAEDVSHACSKLKVLLRSHEARRDAGARHGVPTILTRALAEFGNDPIAARCACAAFWALLADGLGAGARRDLVTEEPGAVSALVTILGLHPGDDELVESASAALYFLTFPGGKRKARLKKLRDEGVPAALDRLLASNLGAGRNLWAKRAVQHLA